MKYWRGFLIQTRLFIVIVYWFNFTSSLLTTKVDIEILRITFGLLIRVNGVTQWCGKSGSGRLVDSHLVLMLLFVIRCWSMYWSQFWLCREWRDKLLLIGLFGSFLHQGLYNFAACFSCVMGDLLDQFNLEQVATLGYHMVAVKC